MPGPSPDRQQNPDPASVRAITRAKREWERTFDSLHDLVGILDLDRRYLRVNRALAQRLGAAPAAVIGRSCHKALQCAAWTEDRCPHTAAVANGAVHSGEVENPVLGGNFMVKATPLPDDQGEIYAVVCVYRDVSAYKEVLAERDRLIGDLQTALARVKVLSGLLPVCAACKKIRNDQGYWEQIEQFIESHSDAQFTHGVCPDCAQRLYPGYYPRSSKPTGGRPR